MCFVLSWLQAAWRVSCCVGSPRQEQGCCFWAGLMDRLDFCMGDRKKKKKKSASNCLMEREKLGEQAGRVGHCLVMAQLLMARSESLGTNMRPVHWQRGCGPGSEGRVVLDAQSSGCPDKPWASFLPPLPPACSGKRLCRCKPRTSSCIAPSVLTVLPGLAPAKHPQAGTGRGRCDNLLL